MKAVRVLSVAVITAMMFASVAEAKAIKLRGVVPVPGVLANGLVSFDASVIGQGVGKVSLSTRSGRAVASVRGKATNLSGRTFKAKTRDYNVFAATVNAFVGANIFPPNALSNFKKAVLKITKRGRVSGVVKARLTAAELAAVRAALGI